MMENTNVEVKDKKKYFFEKKIFFLKLDSGGRPYVGGRL